MAAWSIRPFASTLSDAHGVLAVEQETFRECPYTPEELLARLSSPEQRLWLAEADGQIIGFVAGLLTHGLHASQLEADLLAVHPRWQRQGIASALLATLRRNAAGAQFLRGVVNPHNPPSSGAFARAGFQPASATCDLMIYRIRGYVPRPLPAFAGAIHAVSEPDEAAQFASLDPRALPQAEAIWEASRKPGLTLLLATSAGSAVGGAELFEVHTLLYSGLWLEWLHAPPGRLHVARVLIAAAIEAAKERGLDEVGCLVAQARQVLRSALQAEGFVPLDSYHIWTATPLAQEGTVP